MAFECRLHSLGSHCLLERVDIDQEDWDLINTWLDTLVDRLNDIRNDIPVCLDYLGTTLVDDEEDTGFCRSRPFMATVTVSSVCQNGSLKVDLTFLVCLGETPAYCP